MATPAEKIQTAFKKLNPEYNVHGSMMSEIITYAYSPKEYAERLLHRERPFPGMPVLKYPAARASCSLNTAEKQMRKLSAATKKLQAAFEAMNSPTIYALVQSGFDYSAAEKLIIMMRDAVDKAPKTIAGMKKAHPEFTSSRTGRPKSSIPFHIAKILAGEYFRATGKPPTVATNAHERGHPAYGPFLDLVRTVFKALKIKASPESMARDAEALWRDREEIRNTPPKLIMRRAQGKITIQNDPDFMIKRRYPRKEKSPSKKSD